MFSSRFSLSVTPGERFNAIEVPVVKKRKTTAFPSELVTKRFPSFSFDEKEEGEKKTFAGFDGYCRGRFFGKIPPRWSISIISLCLRPPIFEIGFDKKAKREAGPFGAAF